MANKVSSIQRIEQLLSEGAFKIIPLNPNRPPVDKNISLYGRSGNTVSDGHPILKRGQILQCIDGYHNDGTLRVMVDKRTDFMLGNRPKYSVNPNEDVLVDDLTETALEAIMNEAEVKDFKLKTNKVNRKCMLHEHLTSLVKSCFVVGRSAGGIEREINEDFPYFGEPTSIKLLNPLRLKSPKVGSRNYEFEGLYYDFGEPDRSNVLIDANHLLPLWINDHNLYDNTLYTGMSAIWPILSIAQANTYINDEDIPESAKSLWAKWGFVYVGDKNADSMTKFEKNAKVGTLFYHNNPMLDAKIFDLKQDIRELTDVRMANMKAMCINFGFPMFLLFEDSANFATAKEVMQGYKAGVLERDRTWLRNFLERYWYDPMLADHLNISDLDELLDAKIKVKAAFDDVNFETRRDIAETDIQYLNANVMLPIDLARNAEMAPEIIERLEQFDENEQMEMRMQKLKNEANPPQKLGENGQPQDTGIKPVKITPKKGGL